MKEKVDITGAPDRLVIIETPYHTSDKHTMCLAFTTRQVLEIRDTIKIRPIPFSAPFLLGLYPWNNKILPVIDLQTRLGMQGEKSAAKNRYLILRTGMPDNGNSACLHHLIVRVSSQISLLAADDLPSSPVPAGVEPQDIRGVFRMKKQVLIVPDLPHILQVEHGHS